MTSRTANFVLIIFDLLMLGAIYYLFHEHSAIISSINSKVNQITFDTGLYYLILGTILPLLRIIQLTVVISKARNYHKTANIIIVAWFVLCLVFANLFPYHVKSRLKNSGYHYCGDKATHRIFRGSNSIYKLSDCK